MEAQAIQEVVEEPRSESRPVRARDVVALALDLPDVAEAVAAVRRLGDGFGTVKIGLQLFLAVGWDGVGTIMGAAAPGTRLFLDLKLHDIPTTVAGAMRSVQGRVPDEGTLVTVSFRAGPASAQAAMAEASSARVLLVDRLTSSARAQSDWLDRDFVAALHSSPAAGAVCPAHLVPDLVSAQPDRFVVTPGIRPTWAGLDDQKAVATPEEAVLAGSSLLVVGRPVTAADDQEEAASAVLAEVEGALALRRAGVNLATRRLDLFEQAFASRRENRYPDVAHWGESALMATARAASIASNDYARVQFARDVLEALRVRR